MVDRAEQYNWSSWTGGTKNPFSIALSAFVAPNKHKCISIRMTNGAYMAATDCDEANPNNTELSLTNKQGVIPYEEKGNQGNKAKENVAEYKIAYENTLVINSMNVIIGSVGISHYFGCVSPVYYVFKETENADLRFISYIFSTVEM